MPRLTLVFLCAIAVLSHCHVTTSPPHPEAVVRRYRATTMLADEDATRDCAPRSAEEDARITAEGVARIRERARQRTNGVPQKIWSKSSDRPVAIEEHTPVPPTREQAEAADALFETMLSDRDLPEGFGEGLDDFIGGKKPRA